MPDVKGSFRDLKRTAKVCEKGLHRADSRWGFVVPTALWWTSASLQSPGRVRFASPGDKDTKMKKT